MDNQLEQARDAWVNAFFTGNVELLAHYEDEDFKVVYTAESCVENRETRYANIQHAVNNGVWKPIKPNVDSEEYKSKDLMTDTEDEAENNENSEISK